MNNKDLWDRVKTTDPKSVRPISGKQYQGNSPKPYWIVERLTEEFGPCGIGWGFTIVSERMERLGPDDVLHIAVVDFWYTLTVSDDASKAGFPDAKLRGHIQQIGQTKATYMSSKDKLVVDEDAPKKSVTDALVKCASYIGFAGDIFSGRWDDSKYVAQANAEYRAKEAEAKATPADAKALDELRSAAMEGGKALRDKFESMSAEAGSHAPTKEWFAALWKTHSATLKAAADKADLDHNARKAQSDQQGDREDDAP
jgi:hypothetical protein